MNAVASDGTLDPGAASRGRDKIGVIGLGPIGRAIVGRVRSAGFPVYVWSARPQPEPNFLGSCTELAAICDVIQVLVAEETALAGVLERLSPMLERRHAVILSSAIAPRATREFVERIAARGAAALEAPFGGGRGEAERGELVYHVAGAREAFERVRPALACAASSILYLGERFGVPTMVRVAVALVEAAGAQAVAEAMAILHGCGVHPGALGEALAAERVGSPFLRERAEAIAAHDFTPGRPARSLLRDLENALELARRAGVDAPAGNAARGMLRSAVDKGWQDEDHSVVARHYFEGPLADRAEG